MELIKQCEKCNKVFQSYSNVMNLQSMRIDMYEIKGCNYCDKEINTDGKMSLNCDGHGHKSLFWNKRDQCFYFYLDFCHGCSVCVGYVYTPLALDEAIKLVSYDTWRSLELSFVQEEIVNYSCVRYDHKDVEIKNFLHFFECSGIKLKLPRKSMYKELGFTEYDYICKDIKLCECMRFPMVNFPCIEGASREFYNFLRSVQGKKVSVGRICEMYSYIDDNFDKPSYCLESLGKQLLFPERVSYLCLPFDVMSRVEVYLSSIDFRVLNCVSKTFKYEIEFCESLAELMDILPNCKEFQSDLRPCSAWSVEIQMLIVAFDLSYEDVYRYTWAWVNRFKAGYVIYDFVKFFYRYVAYSVGSNYELIYMEKELECDAFDAIRMVSPNFKLGKATIFRKLALSFEDFYVFRMRVLGRSMSARSVNWLVGLIKVRDCVVKSVGRRDYECGRYDHFLLKVRYGNSYFTLELVPVVQDQNEARYGIKISEIDTDDSRIVMCDKGSSDQQIVSAVCHVTAFFDDVLSSRKFSGHLIDPLMIDRAMCFEDYENEYNMDSQEEVIFEENVKMLCNECLRLDCVCSLCAVCIRDPCICNLPRQNLFCYVCGGDPCICVD